jgi:alpha-L-arabinofuranosidase
MFVTSQFAWTSEQGTTEQGGKNLVANDSFENAGDDGPTGWKTHTWQGDGAFSHDALGRSGKRSVSISSANGGDLSWFIKVSVEPYSRYRLSGWVKTENIVSQGGSGALFNLHNVQAVKTPALLGTHDWTRLQVECETEELDQLQINCLFGGWGLATGKAQFDDLKLELLAPPPKPEITIDATKRGAPIAAAIYGQFIEHLGRCIYGGIWAEMLEDRKFWYPITASFAP